ncbi:Cathepsin B-like cysteine proteinase 6 [Symbiodinium microadriaticum]|uniref:Cathepsin B-like cysteine proteinase 6 n=1 Tax=Symbiodinium microadriaticum TaxID=2951 RepID=A0A1Q9DNG3_SYMMI|nr:Cathepsin B-like cysteine proteinase 6 [Symbiodinium microadriaticum]
MTEDAPRHLQAGQRQPKCAPNDEAEFGGVAHSSLIRERVSLVRCVMAGEDGECPQRITHAVEDGKHGSLCNRSCIELCTLDLASWALHLWRLDASDDQGSVFPRGLEFLFKGVTWTPSAVERFAPEAPGASKSLCGVKGNTTKSIESAVKRGEIHRFVAEMDGDIPEDFDSAAQWPECEKMINDIRDQSNCGCCWAFAGAEAASDRMCIATKGKTMIPISAQDVCFNSNPDGCDGGQIDTPWQYIKDTGAVSGGQYKGTGPFGSGLCSDFSLPHCHHHGPQGKDPYPAEGKPGCPSEESPAGPTQCDATAKAPHNDFKEDKYYYKGKTQTASGEKAIQQMIMAGGPVETAFTVFSDFELYTSGIYHHVSGSMAGGHAVRMVGWGVDGGVKYWKVANSWNPYWGEKGFFRIRRGTNEGGIEDDVVGSSSDVSWTENAGGAVGARIGCRDCRLRPHEGCLVLSGLPEERVGLVIGCPTENCSGDSQHADHEVDKMMLKS